MTAFSVMRIPTKQIGKIAYTGSVSGGAFVLGEVVTGGTSGAKAVVKAVDTTNKIITVNKIYDASAGVTKLFVNSETVSGAGGASVTTAAVNAFDIEVAPIKRLAEAGWTREKFIGKITLASTGNLTFASSDNSIVRASGSWITDGVVAGKVVSIGNSATSNSGSYTVTSVASATKVIVSESVVNETLTSPAVAAYKRVTTEILAAIRSERTAYQDWFIAPTFTLTVPVDGNYVTDGYLTFTLVASEGVNIDVSGGVPYIPLTIGSTARRAIYTEAGSTATNKLFKYLVVGADADLDGIVVANTVTKNGAVFADDLGVGGAKTISGAVTYTVGDTSGVLVNAV